MIERYPITKYAPWELFGNSFPDLINAIKILDFAFVTYHFIIFQTKPYTASNDVILCNTMVTMIN
jgi:hypothetical protein